MKVLLHTYIYINKNIYVHVHIHIYVCIHTYIYAHVCTYIHAYRHEYPTCSFLVLKRHCQCPKLESSIMLGQSLMHSSTLNLKLNGKSALQRHTKDPKPQPTDRTYLIANSMGFKTSAQCSPKSDIWGPCTIPFQSHGRHICKLHSNADRAVCVTSMKGLNPSNPPFE